MGAGELKATTDAGPLIHLAEIGCLRFLNSFDALHVPDAVWLETVAQGRISRTDLSNLQNVQRHSLAESEVEQFVKQSAIKTGLVNIYAQGATAAIMIQENWDDSVQTDVVHLLQKMIPRP